MSDLKRIPTDTEILIVLNFLNSVKTFRELESAFDYAGKPVGGIKVVPNFFELRARVGRLNTLGQVCHVLQVYEENIPEIVRVLRGKGLVE